MKVYNKNENLELSSQIKELIHNYRMMRNFSPIKYIHLKSEILNQYMTKCKLKSVVVAVSGGIDSALVLSLVNYAKNLPNSPIEKIIAVSLPVNNSKGATGQIEATSRAKELCDNLKIDLNVIDLKSTHQNIEEKVSSSLNIKSSDWALGQLVAHTRTPTLYYLATLLTQNNLPSIIVGTTNKDEGLYLGYFGKASDGLVDLQLISDLHKSEVYNCSKYLNIPKSILEVSPQGDMYDGRIDEEVFGAPYDFVEYYLHFLTLNTDLQQLILNSLDENSYSQFILLKSNLENLHNYNKHKYYSASPAVHLDLDFMKINEGWKTNNYINKPIDKPIIKNNFVGLFEIDDIPKSFLQLSKVKKDEFIVQGNSILKLENVLNADECKYLLNQTENQNWLKANKYGSTKNLNIDDKVESSRLSIYNQNLSYFIYNRISSYLDNYKIYDNERPIISNNKRIWYPIGLNPLFRYIKYDKNQSLVAHYDDTYEFNEFKKTLLTVVIYLNDSEAKTRFIYDEQINLKDIAKNYQDKNSIANDNDVLLEFKAKAGDVLIFDHRVLHDATYPENSKTIIRTDVIFESPYYGFEL